MRVELKHIRDVWAVYNATNTLYKFCVSCNCPEQQSICRTHHTKTYVYGLIGTLFIKCHTFFIEVSTLWQWFIDIRVFDVEKSMIQSTVKQQFITHSSTWKSALHVLCVDSHSWAILETGQNDRKSHRKHLLPFFMESICWPFQGLRWYGGFFSPSP